MTPAGGRAKPAPPAGEAPAPDDAAPHYHGHRDRLRARFAEIGGDALPDYELLELLLFRSIPQRDVKPLAKELIRRFGSFAEVLGAPAARLREVKGVGESVALDLKIVAASLQRMARGAVAKRPVLSSWSAVLDYCRMAMAFAEREQFRVLPSISTFSIIFSPLLITSLKRP